MAVTTNNLYTGGIGDLNTFINSSAIGIFERNKVFSMFGDVKSLGMGNNQLQRSIENDMDITEDNAQLTEGVTPTSTDNDFTAVKIQTTQYGATSTITDRTGYQSPIDEFEKTARQIGEKMARIHDRVIQDGINDGDNVLYGGNATSRVTVDNTDVLDFSLLSKVATRLDNNNAPQFGGNYVGVIHPFVAFDMFGDTGATYASVQSATDGGNQSALEEVRYNKIGTYYGITLYTTSNLKVFSGAGAGSIDVYPCYFMGREAFGVVNEGGLNVSTTGFVPSDSDPLAQRAKVSGKVSVGADILKQESLYRIEVGTAASS